MQALGSGSDSSPRSPGARAQGRRRLSLNADVTSVFQNLATTAAANAAHARHLAEGVVGPISGRVSDDGRSSDGGSINAGTNVPAGNFPRSDIFGKGNPDDRLMFEHQAGATRWRFEGNYVAQNIMTQTRKAHRSANKQLPRANFNWLPQPQSEEGEVDHAATITATEIASKHGVPEDYVIEYLRREIEEAESCQSLPFTVVMVVAFAAMVLFHDPVTPVNSVEDSLTFDVWSNANYAFTSEYIGHKGIDNVNSHADFWSFLHRGLIPLLLRDEVSLSEGLNISDANVASQLGPLPREERGFVLNYNKIIGGIRLRQERSGRKSCVSEEKLRPFYGKSCVGGHSYELFPEVWEGFDTTDPTAEFWLWSDQSVEYLQGEVEKRELEGWLNEETKKIEISVPVFNAEYQVYTIAFVNFFWSRSGHVWKRIIPMSTYSSWWHDARNIVTDVIWLLCILWITGTEILKIYGMYRHSGWRGVRRDYIKFWTIIDWISVFIAFALIIIFALRLAGSADLEERLSSIAATDVTVNPQSYRDQCRNFLESLDAEVKSAYELRILIGVYPMVVIMRLFKAFAAQAALSIVTRTLYAAGADLLHFLLVFISIFMSAVIGGVLLFGREDPDHTTVFRSSITLFRALMTDFDWDAMQVIGRHFAGTFFVLFMAIMVMLMLNMLLAIVMDAYSQEKEKLGTADTLYEETVQNLTRWRGQRKGEMMSLPDILRYVSKERDARDMRALKSVGSALGSLDGGAAGALLNSDGGMSQTGSAFQSTEQAGGEKSERSKTLQFMRRSQSGGASSSQTSLEGLRRWFAQSRGKSAASSRSFDEQFTTSETRVVILTMDKLKAVCPKMQTEQAIGLLEDATISYWNDNKETVGVEESLQHIHKLDRMMSLVHKRIKKKFDALFPGARRGHSHHHHEHGEGNGDQGQGQRPQQDKDSDSEDDDDQHRRRGAKQKHDKSHHGHHQDKADHRQDPHYASQGTMSSDDIAPRASQGEDPDAEDSLYRPVAFFAHVVHALQTHLGKVKFFESEELVESAHLHPSIVSNYNVPSSERKPFQTMDEVPVWGFVRILDHGEAVLNSCRLSGIGLDHDKERLESLGCLARCVQLDFADNTIRCRVTGHTADIWMPLGALTAHVPDKALPIEVEDKLLGTTHKTDPEAAQHLKDLQQEITVGKNTINEAMRALSELQWRAMKEQEEKGKIVSKFKLLHHKVRALGKEHTRLQEELRRQEDRLTVVSSSKDEYVELVHTMIDENQRLKEKLASTLASQMDWRPDLVSLRGPTSRAQSRTPALVDNQQALVVQSRRHPQVEQRRRSDGADSGPQSSDDPIAQVGRIADDFRWMRDEVLGYLSNQGPTHSTGEPTGR